MADKEFIIPFVGLKQGVHEFEFEIGNAFFEGIEYSVVNEGSVKVHFSLDKKEAMLVGDYTLSGTVKTACGRCTDPVDAAIEGEFRLVYKFDDKPSEDESLVIVYPEEYEIDIKESILEFISVSVPSRAIHKEGDCNEDIIEILSEYQVFSLAKDPNEDFDNEEMDDEDWDSEEENTEAFDEESEDNLEENGDNEDEEREIDPRWAALKGLKNDGKPSKD